MKRLTPCLFLILMFFSTGSVKALQIYFTEPVVISSIENIDSVPDFLNDLPRQIRKSDYLNCLTLTPVKTDKKIKSLIDAGALAMNKSLDYLLFGTVEITAQWSEVRFSLYERETDSIRTVFYGKVAQNRIADLVPEMARKLTNYLYEQFGIRERIRLNKSPGYAELSLTPGYWGVLSSSWSDVLLGYFHAGITGEIALSEPRYYFNGNELYPCFGLSIDYGLGRNRVGVENYFYHSLQASLPLELSLDLRGGHRFRLGIAPGYQFDFLVQERKYGDRFQGYSGAFLLKASFLYTYFPGAGNFSIGLLNNVDFAFYDNLQVSYRPSVFLSYKLTTFKEKKNEK